MISDHISWGSISLMLVGWRVLLSLNVMFRLRRERQWHVLIAMQDDAWFYVRLRRARRPR